MEHKFKIGDRVQVVRIDNDKADYLGEALYHIGDVGTIIGRDTAGHYGNDYCIDFDRLQQVKGRSKWYALEKWIKPADKLLITCE